MLQLGSQCLGLIIKIFSSESCITIYRKLERKPFEVNAEIDCIAYYSKTAEQIFFLFWRLPFYRLYRSNRSLCRYTRNWYFFYLNWLSDISDWLGISFDSFILDHNWLIFLRVSILFSCLFMISLAIASIRARTSAWARAAMTSHSHTTHKWHHHWVWHNNWTILGLFFFLWYFHQLLLHFF